MPAPIEQWRTTSDGWIYPANYAEAVDANKYTQAIAKVYGMSDVAQRRAALIAAAPELLAALQATLSPLILLGDFIGNEFSGSAGIEPFNRCEIILNAINAIARATGQEATLGVPPARSDSLTTPLGCRSFLQIPPPLRVSPERRVAK